MTKGWRLESARHALARKGIETGRRPSVRATHHIPSTNIDFSGDNFGFEKSNGFYKLRLGNMTTTGWYWTGDKSDLGGFFYRIAHSTTTDDFLKGAEENGLKYSDIKQDVIQSIKEHDAGIYEATGDNRVWHFGEDYLDAKYEIEDFAKEKGYNADDIDPWAYYEGNSYEAFKKSDYYKDTKEELLEAYTSSATFEVLFEKFKSEDFTLSMMETTSNFQTDKFQKALMKWEEENKKKGAARQDFYKRKVSFQGGKI